MAIRRNKTKQLEDFISKVEVQLNNKVIKSKTKSKYNGQPCIAVPSELAFNLDGGAWLDELVNNNLIDNRGNYYSIGVLTPQQLCELTDKLK